MANTIHYLWHCQQKDHRHRYSRALISMYIFFLTICQLQEKFGSDFDKYLIRELIDQIDLKDPNKPSKDRSEPIKCLLLNQELARACLNSDFLHYFEEVRLSFLTNNLDRFNNLRRGQIQRFLKRVCYPPQAEFEDAATCRTIFV